MRSVRRHGDITMNWDALSAIAELISAIGVIATLGYLAIQIRANTKEAKLASTSDISNQMNQFLQHVTSNPEISHLWLKALEKDPSELTDIEVQRAVMLMGNIARIIENAYLQFLEGRMDAASWEGYRRYSDLGMNSKIFPVYWARRRDLHGSKFSALVETIAKETSGSSLFDRKELTIDDA